MLYDIKDFDYTNGVFELLLSGSVGSAKSMLLAHIAVDHCLRNPGAVFGIGRLALPRLKETLCQKIREHLDGTGIRYSYDQTKGSFKFSNGSRIVAFSWADKQYEKFRSYELSGMGFEELSENRGDHERAYKEAFARVGRLRHVKEKLIVSASNPDSPGHWAYKYFINNKSASRRVYYSRTSDNPFLPKSYIKNLTEMYDPKMYKRMVLGQWIEISDEVIYHTYDSALNFKDYEYKVDDRFPIYMFFDFNIGHGKPLSLGFHQFIRGEYHVFAEVIIEGQRTEDALVEAYNRGLLDHDTNYVVHGDATGRARNTRSVHSDYDVIEDYLESKRIRFDIDVPRSNPPIRERHNIVNRVILSQGGKRRLFVYKGCDITDEGLRLTALKKNANYLEDDSKRYQHITTALGYSLCQTENDMLNNKSETSILTLSGGKWL